MRKFNFTLIVIINVLAFRIRFVLAGHLVPIFKLVTRFIFRLATYLFLAGSDPASSPFSVVSLNTFYFWVFFHHRTVLGYKDQM